MSTLALALNDEIRRLARKEIKAQTSITARAVTQYRREIPRLKRRQRDLEKRLTALEKQSRKALAAPAADLNGPPAFPRVP
jgi:hypothetical protein